MASTRTDLGPPIRVVLFCGGRRLQHIVARFAGMLDAHPEIELLAVLCRAERCALHARAHRLWKRRGPLAVPLALAEGFGRAAALIRQPLAPVRHRRHLRRLAGRLQYVPDIHAPAVLAQVRRLEPDLGLIYGGPLLKPELFEIPRLGTLGIHHGKLPAYRGKKTIFWAVYNREPAVTVTIQRVNAAVDGGEIVREQSIEVGHRPLHALRGDLQELGLSLYLRAILDVRHGIASYRSQPPGPSRPYRDPRPADMMEFARREAGRMLAGVLGGATYSRSS